LDVNHAIEEVVNELHKMRDRSEEPSLIFEETILGQTIVTSRPNSES